MNYFKKTEQFIEDAFKKANNEVDIDHHKRTVK